MNHQLNNIQYIRMYVYIYIRYSPSTQCENCVNKTSKNLCCFVKLENLDDPGEIGAQNQVHVDFGVQ